VNNYFIHTSNDVLLRQLTNTITHIILYLLIDISRHH